MNCLEEVTSCRHETLGFVLTVQTLHRQHNKLVFLFRRRTVMIFKSFSIAESRPFW